MIKKQTIDAKGKIYTCPMHPEVKFNKSGTCPKCGMYLVETTAKKETTKIEIKKSVITIFGMHCASCAQTIENALQKTKGVKEANVNFATSKAYITHEVD